MGGKNMYREARIKCTKCLEEVRIPITEEVMERAKASPSGITSVAVDHGNHVVLVYLDSEGKERGTEIMDAMVEEKPSRAGLRQIPIPQKAGDLPRVSALTEEEWRILTLSDGNRTIEEIAFMMKARRIQVKILVERLLNRGYLERIEVRL